MVEPVGDHKLGFAVGVAVLNGEDHLLQRGDDVLLHVGIAGLLRQPADAQVIAQGDGVGLVFAVVGLDLADAVQQEPLFLQREGILCVLDQVDRPHDLLVALGLYELFFIADIVLHRHDFLPPCFFRVNLFNLFN